MTLKVSGVKLSSHFNVVRLFLLELTKKIKEIILQPNQLYNANESALFWKSLPNRTMVHAKEHLDVKYLKNEFSTCANGDCSNKLKVIVIGKSIIARAFKTCSIPVEYHSTKSAWMTYALFLKWLHEYFVEQMTRFQKKQRPFIN